MIEGLGKVLRKNLKKRFRRFLASSTPEEATRVRGRPQINLLSSAGKCDALYWWYLPDAGKARQPRCRTRERGVPFEPRLRIGEVLTRRTGLAEKEIQEALTRQKVDRRRLGRILVEMGCVGENDLVVALGEQLDFRTIHPGEVRADPVAAAMVPPAVALRHQMLPIGRQGDRILVVMSDPLDCVALDELFLVTGLRALTYVATPQSIAIGIEATYGVDSGHESPAALCPFEDPVVEFSSVAMTGLGYDVAEDAGQSDAPIVKLVQLILAKAVESDASEILLESLPQEFRVRLRAKGRLWTEMMPPKLAATAILRRLEVLAGIRGLTSRSGMFRMRVHGHLVTFHFENVDSVHGAGARLKVSGSQPEVLTWADHGIGFGSAERFEKTLERGPGLHLVVGRPHSGRATFRTHLLRNALGGHGGCSPQGNGINGVDGIIGQARADPGADPGQARAAGADSGQARAAGAMEAVGQARADSSRVKTALAIEHLPRANIGNVNLICTDRFEGKAFDRILSRIKGMEPDVVLIEDLPSIETIEAGLDLVDTGLTLITTISACNLDLVMGLLGRMPGVAGRVVESLRTITTTTLVPASCSSCRESFVLSPTEAEDLGMNPTRIPQAPLSSCDLLNVDSPAPAISVVRNLGCPDCRGQGWRGQMGVHEALITNPDLNRVLLEPGNAHRTRPIALDAGMTDSWTSCLGLVLRGQVAPDALGALPTG